MHFSSLFKDPKKMIQEILEVINLFPSIILNDMNLYLIEDVPEFEFHLAIMYVEGWVPWPIWASNGIFVNIL